MPDVVILEKKAVGLGEESLARFVVRVRRAVGLPGTVNVLVTGTTSMRSLNRRFRGKNKATDVLSFPAASSPRSNRKRAALAGEIAISADIARATSTRLGHSMSTEIRILII